MNKRISKFNKVDKIIPESQISFQPGLRTVGTIKILHELVTDSLQRKKKVYAAFVDLQKVFDYTDKDKLEMKMISAGCARKFASSIKNSRQHGR